MKQRFRIRHSAVLLLASALLAGWLPATGAGAQEAREEAPEVAQESEPAQQTAPEKAGAQAEEQEQPSGYGAIEWPEPPDGVWLTDEEGREYFIDKTRKVEGKYKRLGDGVVRVRNLMPIKVEREDDDWFYYRVYKIERPQGPPGALHKKPTAEELAAVAATYRTDVPSVDRLRFEPFDAGLPQQGQWRNGFDFADMDGDGHLDLIHGPARKGMGGPAIFLGDGAGNWSPWAAHWPAAPYEYGDAEAEDFDGDGHQDVAFGLHLMGATVLRGDGEGNFALWSEGIEVKQAGAQSFAFSSREIETADWNGDGRPDLLLLSEGPARPPTDPEALGAAPSGVRVYLNGGDGTWRPVDGPEDNVFGDSLQVADFDGDGRLDFVTGSRVVGYQRILKMGTEDGAWETRQLDLVRPRGLVWSLAIADFDADGHDDLAVAYWSNELSVARDGVDVLLRRPGTDAGWQRLPLAAREREKTDLNPAYTAIGAGDVDGDGNPDVVVFNAQGRGEVFLGDGEGGFGREEVPELEPSPQHRGCSAYEVELVDADGDGRDEIFVGLAGESGSETIFMTTLGRICPSNGALKAWRVATP